MKEDTLKDIRQMVSRAPHWLRIDLSSADPMLRGRAEDALTAMIAAAIDPMTDVKLPGPTIKGEPLLSASS